MTAASRSTRKWTLTLILISALLAFVHLASISPPLSGDKGVSLTSLVSFFSYALSPALDYEQASAGIERPPFLLKVFWASTLTFKFAVVAISLAFVPGMFFGFCGSTEWWKRVQKERALLPSNATRLVGAALFFTTRIVSGIARSVHELLWAVLFLAAFGLGNFAAVLAIAIPYCGTFAKIFGELFDEVPRGAADALRAGGAGPVQAFALATLPAAAPDITAYALYRFECALRSAAVIGFFGPETLGKYIFLAWNENHYHELWTYLFALVLLVAVVDWASGLVRRRLLPAA